MNRVVPTLLLLSGCLFTPNVAPSGYTTCSTDADCPSGRFCDESLCAPPPWRSEEFGGRRALIVTNTSDVALEKGAAVPITVGSGDELINIQELGADFRFSDFDRAANTWIDVAVYLDREDDRFTAWVPLQREVPPGRDTLLAWIENKTFDGAPRVIEDPTTVFRAFDSFDAPLDDETWFTQGDPAVNDGLVNVADNQAIVWRTPLLQPVLVQAIARVNGATCDNVFIGLVGDDEAIFETPPSAGVFVDEDRAGSPSLAPTADSVPTNVGDPFIAPGSLTRYTVAIDGASVRISVDDVVFQDLALVPQFDADPLFFAVQVGGACSVDVEAVWASPLPQPLPTVLAEPPVTFDLSFDG